MARLADGMGEQAKQVQEPDVLRMLASLPMRQFANFLAAAGTGLPPEFLTELVERSR